MKFKTIIFSFLILGFVFCSKPPKVEEVISIQDGAIKLVPAESPHTAAFLKITNNTKSEVKLTGVEANISKVVEIHDMVSEEGVMKMRPVPSIAIPSNSTVELKPGSLHIMFLNLNEPLKENGVVDLKFNFDNGTSLTEKFTIKAIETPKSME
jgi:periplasmic copper chaperone A